MQSDLAGDKDVLHIMLDSTLQKNMNVLDKAIRQMIIDSRDQNDDSLKILEKPIFQSDTPIEQLDVDDSLVLKLAYKRRA